MITLQRNNTKRLNRPELLAPAGSVETFMAAVDAGADAVYIGLKGYSARASARSFTIKECADLVQWGHKKGIAVYVALNSLVRADDAGKATELVKEIVSISPDAVILQDLGILFLFKNLASHVKVHLSTLSGIHTLSGVKAAAEMGVSRVVLARELPLDAVCSIAKAAPIEVETFVHGALCFSFSGFCLMSSFRGGRSGLMGECAQPCRLRYRQEKKEGYFLSCNDFSGIRFVPKLKKSGIAALKIEGRMKSADYVYGVVRAYRLVLDAETADEERERVQEAEEILRTIPSRRLSTGFWGANPSKDVLHSGKSATSGILVATAISGKKMDVPGLWLRVQKPFGVNDLLRPESRAGREEPIQHVKKIYSDSGDYIDRAIPGSKVFLPDIENFPAGTRFFRIGSRSENPRLLWSRIRSQLDKQYVSGNNSVARINPDIKDLRSFIKKHYQTLILKVASPQDLPGAFHSPAQWVSLSADLHNLEVLARTRLSETQKKRLILSLPSPIIREEELGRAVRWFLDRQFAIWEINNLAHFDFFNNLAPDRSFTLIGGPRLNVRNRYAVAELAERGCTWVTLSPEITLQELEDLMQNPLPAVPVILVYHRLPLIVSALKPDLKEGKPFVSPDGERYLYQRAGGFTYIHAERPVGWFSEIPKFIALGYRVFEIDLSNTPSRMRKKELEEVIKAYERQEDHASWKKFNLGMEKGGRHARMRNTRIQSSG